MHVGKIAVKVDLFLPIGRVAAHRVVRVVVFREVRVVPVDQGIIQAHAQPLGAHRVHKLPHEIAAAGRVRALVVCQLGIEQAEAVVMLRRQHDILHPGAFSPPRPVSGVISLRGKFLHVTLVFLRRHPRAAHVPFAAPGDRVEPPVQEHPEPRLLKPLYPLFSFRHRTSLSRPLRRVPFLLSYQQHCIKSKWGGGLDQNQGAPCFQGAPLGIISRYFLRTGGGSQRPVHGWHCPWAGAGRPCP